MEKRNYQYNHLKLYSGMYKKEEREKRALKILAVIKDFLKSHSSKKMKDLQCLDIGCSSGIITYTLAPYFKKIIGGDIDRDAIKLASKMNKRGNLSFKIIDALNLPFSNNHFDVVICNNVYEHVPNPNRMMTEIYRVLKKGGICYFAATNKYMIIESDHKLPFLSWLPIPLASIYFKIMGKGDYYYERPFSHNQLKKLLFEFKTYEYTIRVLKDPETFKVDHKTSGLISYIPSVFIKPFTFFSPQFFWILVKEK